MSFSISAYYHLGVFWSSQNRDACCHNPCRMPRMEGGGGGEGSPHFIPDGKWNRDAVNMQCDSQKKLHPLTRGKSRKAGRLLLPYPFKSVRCFPKQISWSEAPSTSIALIYPWAHASQLWNEYNSAHAPDNPLHCNKDTPISILPASSHCTLRCLPIKNLKVTKTLKLSLLSPPPNRQSSRHLGLHQLWWTKIFVQQNHIAQLLFDTSAILEYVGRESINLQAHM